jgi:hypothetical protein
LVSHVEEGPQYPKDWASSSREEKKKKNKKKRMKKKTQTKTKKKKNKKKEPTHVTPTFTEFSPVKCPASANVDDCCCFLFF